ncbi:MAG: hypothetical protein MJ210_04020 [Alphaproteobacteria bacterium]|nr:hypothetical protein [Alphaproteobacteria bacterium]
MKEKNQDMKKDSGVVDYLKRLGSSVKTYQALYLNFKSLSDEVKTAQIRKAVQECFSLGAISENIKFFLFPNEDIAVVFKSDLRDAVASCLVKVKFLLQRDVLVQKVASLEECGVASWYDLSSEYTDFVRRADAAYNVQELPKPQGNASFFDTSSSKIYIKQLTTEMLAKVQKIISVADFSSFVRRQSICAIIGKSLPQRVFEEVFVSIPDMRDSLLPEVNITSNPWLFLALTETLDRRVLELISRHDDGSLIGNFSVNINVSTILSDDFLRFDDSINGGMRQTIILELQLTDIFSDIRSFILAKTFAKARGYKICIDGITYDQLSYLNRSGLDCDLMKIVWHPELVNIFSKDEHFKDYMNKAERAKIILCRVENAEAVAQGNNLGINLYQGRYVQSLLNPLNQKN